MKQLHPIQLAILNRLLFKKSLNYMSMKPDKFMENNKFQFHLNQLRKSGYIEKINDYYELTTSGKQYASRIDSDNITLQLQAKISARICCERYHKGEKQFLLYTRLKHPFFGCQGFPAGKVRYGETLIDAAVRELKEETNLEGVPMVAFITHYITQNSQSSEILEDKLMFVFIVRDPKGKLTGCKEGKYEWVNVKDIETFLTKPFESKKAFIREVEMLDTFDGDIQIIETTTIDKGKF